MFNCNFLQEQGGPSPALFSDGKPSYTGSRLYQHKPISLRTRGSKIPQPYPRDSERSHSPRETADRSRQPSPEQNASRDLTDSFDDASLSVEKQNSGTKQGIISKQLVEIVNR